MTTALSEEYQHLAANAIAHEAFMAGQAWQMAARSYERPSVLFKPKLFKDGDHWCALLGRDIQEGICGFGKSPSAAMYAFDEAWQKELPDHD